MRVLLAVRRRGLGAGGGADSAQPGLEHAKEGMGSHGKETGWCGTVKVRGGGGNLAGVVDGRRREKAGGGAVKEERRREEVRAV